MPLCPECEPIHLEEHHKNRTQYDIVRFNEAYLKAINDIEDHIGSSRKGYQEIKVACRKDQ